MKRNLYNTFTRTFTGASLALALSVAASASAESIDRPSPFTGIVAFGDSLTDTGNFFNLTGIPPEPYYQGRFSDGPVWIEYFASGLRLAPDAIVNYAVGGSATGRDNENDVPGVAEFPGLQDQLDQFEADLAGRRTDPRALHVVWAGANDFFVSTTGPEETIATGVGNTIVALQRLRQAGARHIMVLNMPDLGLTPLGTATGNAASLSYLTAAYNQTLDAALDQFETRGLRIIRVDSASTLQKMVFNPETYGFSNVNDAYLATGGDPRGFLFWDVIHPTTLGHEIVADDALTALREHFRGFGVAPNEHARLRPLIGKLRARLGR
jgi:phospholipase/lecithinase/hemolysin